MVSRCTKDIVCQLSCESASQPTSQQPPIQPAAIQPAASQPASLPASQPTNQPSIGAADPREPKRECCTNCFWEKSLNGKSVFSRGIGRCRESRRHQVFVFACCRHKDVTDLSHSCDSSFPPSSFAHKKPNTKRRVFLTISR